MQRVLTLYRSSVGKKVAMALSGIVLTGFLLLHMAGNLKIFSGQQGFDAYAAFLREIGSPAVPDKGLLWTLRILLLLAVVVHVVAAFQTWSESRAARDVGYRKLEDLSFSYASRTMRWGGVIILLFIVYHLLHFTTGQAHPDFREGEVYHNFVVAFQSPWVVAVYLLVQAVLCLHLYHGLWSLTQTLGLNHARYNRLRRPAAAVLVLGVFAGFVVPPVLVLVGYIS